MDTVKVAVLDPQEVWGAMADHGCHLSFFFSLHQDGHKVVNFIHVHVPHVVTADEHLDPESKEQNMEAEDIIKEALPRH